MKYTKKTLTIALLFVSTICVSQTNSRRQKAVKDYSFCVYQNFRWGSDSFKYFMITSLQREGYYGQLEIMKGMETIDKNLEFRKATYRAWGKQFSNVDILGGNLLGIGMSASNAEIMANYIIKFYENETSSESGLVKDKNDSSPPYFTGTKRFCEKGAWDFVVTIINNSITIKAYPNKTNPMIKNKLIASKIEKGYIKNGKIYTKDESGSYVSDIYKYENGVLYELNIENEYNTYYLCK